MTLHFLGLGTSTRDDVPVGNPTECSGSDVPFLFRKTCVDLSHPAELWELKTLLNEVGGYAVRTDVDLWTPDEEQALWHWALDQEARPGKVSWSVHELLRQTPSRWVYPSPIGLLVLWNNKKCVGDSCAQKYPTFSALGDGLGTVLVEAPKTGTAGKPPAPPPNHDQPPPYHPPPPDQPPKRAGLMPFALACSALAIATWYAVRHKRRPA